MKTTTYTSPANETRSQKRSNPLHKKLRNAFTATIQEDRSGLTVVRVFDHNDNLIDVFKGSKNMVRDSFFSIYTDIPKYRIQEGPNQYR